MTRDALHKVADDARHVQRGVAWRWAFTYGDVARDLLRRVAEDPQLGEEIAEGVPLVELEHAWSAEEARCGADFLERRTKLKLALGNTDQARVERWFVERMDTLDRGAKANEQ